MVQYLSYSHTGRIIPIEDGVTNPPIIIDIAVIDWCHKSEDRRLSWVFFRKGRISMEDVAFIRSTLRPFEK